MLELLKRHIVVVIIASVLLVGIFVLNKEDSFDEETDLNFEQQIELVEQEVESETVEAKVIVDVKGEVTDPGVYEMEHDSRIKDVIQIAGGFTKHADQSIINLAQRVQDEMVVIVPKEGEELANPSPIETSNTSSDGESKVNINEATVQEFESLSGIGPKKAQAIFDHREENGPFQMVEDLTDVSGIGEKTLENIRDSIIIR